MNEFGILIKAVLSDEMVRYECGAMASTWAINPLVVSRLGGATFDLRVDPR